MFKLILRLLCLFGFLLFLDDSVGVFAGWSLLLLCIRLPCHLLQILTMALSSHFRIFLFGIAISCVLSGAVKRTYVVGLADAFSLTMCINYLHALRLIRQIIISIPTRLLILVSLGII